MNQSDFTWLDRIIYPIYKWLFFPSKDELAMRAMLTLEPEYIEDGIELLRMFPKTYKKTLKMCDGKSIY